MALPSYSSDEDFLGSLGISHDEVDLMADADTHASMTSIFAQIDSRIKLDVAESSVAGIPLEIFNQNSPAGPSRLAGPSRAPRAILEAIGPLHPDLASLRLPYNISYFVPNSPPTLREVSLDNVERETLLSENINEIKPDTSLIKRIHKRFNINLYFPLYGFQVPDELVNQMMELILGMQQELAAAVNPYPKT
ncbi:hypothetical protein JCGZ_01664 [Jatropha curcas]|uniref:Uncharacterized protein n=1 Tax=Jatropha curcas TaxID=180498 RepID=A0A067JGI8_JATCU|nr:hypothetical protein JCGZ_01664 [Jatropha curcas]